MPKNNLLIDTLFRLIQELRRDYDSQVRAMGLTFSRARVLVALSRNEGVIQTELAPIIGIEAPSLKRQLDALEMDGLIERRPDRNDARKRALYLSDRARNSPILGYVHTLRAQLLHDIEEEEQASVRAILERIADNAARLGPRERD